jgi:hypothetical protein
LTRRHYSQPADDLAALGGIPQTVNGTRLASHHRGPTWTHPTTGVSGSKYEVSTFGSAFSRKAATKLVKKFITETVKSRTSANVLTNGPKGYTCKALADKQGHAFSGSCLKMHPSPTGFGWSPIK